MCLILVLQETAKLMIPELFESMDECKTFLLLPVTFQGPCKPSPIYFSIEGTIIAPACVDVWKCQDDDRGSWIRSNKALRFYECDSMKLVGFRVVNSPIDSSHVVIANSLMHLGDECVAMNGGSSFINITSVSCAPGHGIYSIGSLGKDRKSWASGRDPCPTL
ncbi:hypothetical protein K1719_013835 [Acacia pycnantha]|nr:hypothetical protein K1719_013835 [Acacia pycnantha]